ncbi:AAA+-type ATPase, SpoVK/Ycf46/Vps4 family [Novosphingobium sp. CF614]|uniref:AAA family ATPase n=1 Tax=Novosphingobium sp. CF614 TaxID=1884364 RepID=UPI0008E49D6B|nr:AAA family ATPase [Novosphingobium sp. CF614]SFG38602.1 AAA+-type ATPase, SpoVK/Ycf46/Vps4 family [Novosphingobium sp. CF614]
MNQIEITRRMLRRAMRGMPAASQQAKALLEFARANGAALFGLKVAEAKKLAWAALKRAVAQDGPCAGESASDGSGVLRLARELAVLLRLDVIDSAIVEVTFALDRLCLPGELDDILARSANDVPAMIGEVAGAEPQDAERRVRLNPLFRMGLVTFRADWRGQVRLETRWALENLLDRLPETEAEIIALMVGPRHVAGLPLSAFAHVEDTEFLRRLLEGTRRERARGINILIHGPPGTGKTEFARSLAAAAGFSLHGAGEADEDGDEPDRRDRIAAFQMGQRLLAGKGDAALLFDEMEDLIGDAQPAQGDWMRGRQGSKVFVNRLLETNPVPVIWTTNAIGNVDPAILRRMSHVLKLDLPSRNTAMRMLDHVAREEAVTPGDGWGSLLENTPEVASVLRVSARGARLAGEADGGLRPARALAKALRGSSDLPLDGPGPIDLDLFETDRPLGPLFERLRESEHMNVSLLLTGVPGTGKTALAHHFARTLDRPLLVRRTSDLLSKWVGETEERIAEAFAEARRKESVLLFDEADSLLFDRSTARTNWEVSQVNELLTWLDRHPLPVVAATNHAQRLDPATLRRFVFKLELRALSGTKVEQAFVRFFGIEPPASLVSLQGITPGDLAVVARQLRYDPTHDGNEIVARLRAEVAAKPGASRPIGF